MKLSTETLVVALQHLSLDISAALSKAAEHLKEILDENEKLQATIDCDALNIKRLSEENTKLKAKYEKL